MPFTMPADNMILDFQEENPKKKGSKAYDNYEIYKWTTSSKEFLSEGGKKADLSYAVDKGFVTIYQETDPAEQYSPSLIEGSAAAGGLLPPSEEEDWGQNEPEMEDSDEETPVISSPVCAPCSPEVTPTNMKTPVKKAPVKKTPVKKAVSPDNAFCCARLWCGVSDPEYKAYFLPDYQFPGEEDFGHQKKLSFGIPTMRCKNKAKNSDYCLRHEKEADSERGLRHGDIRDLPQDFADPKKGLHHWLGYGNSEDCDTEKEDDCLIPVQNWRTLGEGSSFKSDGFGKWEWTPVKFRDSEVKPRTIEVPDNFSM